MENRESVERNNTPEESVEYSEEQMLDSAKALEQEKDAKQRMQELAA